MINLKPKKCAISKVILMNHIQKGTNLEMAQVDTAPLVNSSPAGESFSSHYVPTFHTCT